MEIMKLLPTGKDYLWGGTRLKEEFGKNIPLIPLAETWECSTHPDGPSVIANGTYAGMTLAEVLKLHPEYLGTKAGDKGELPILVKFIDAKQDLSIQVHPNDDYARMHEGQNGKTEFWYVLDAEKEASLVYGFEHPVAEPLLRKAIEEGTLSKHLQRVKIQKGDTFYVPAGTVHGIGSGSLIAEIQESSNVTYRVYDYNRIDKDGNMRPLHIDKAVEVMDMQAAANVKQPHKLIRYSPGCSREILCRCQYFEAEILWVSHEASLSVVEESFQVLLCIEGEGVIKRSGENGEIIPFKKGDCLFLPANLGRCPIQGKNKLLKVRC